MAVSGGITTAYKCRIEAYQLQVAPTSYPKNLCAGVDAALARLQAGETVIVASADMQGLRLRLEGLVVG